MHFQSILQKLTEVVQAKSHWCLGNGEVLLGLPSRRGLVLDCMQPHVSCTSIFLYVLLRSIMIFQLQNSSFLQSLHVQRENSVLASLENQTPKIFHRQYPHQKQLFPVCTLTLFRPSATQKTNQELSHLKASEMVRWMLFLPFLF